MSTPTPRTSAAIIASGFQAVPEGFRAFAGILERELTALATERDQLRARAERAEADLAALEQCHDDNCRGVVKIAADLAAATAERDQLRAEVERLKDRAFDKDGTPWKTICGWWSAKYYDSAERQMGENATRAERAEAELAKERARLDSGQILLTVSGERVWHSGVDLRAAIDAAMQEATK